MLTKLFFFGIVLLDVLGRMTPSPGSDPKTWNFIPYINNLLQHYSFKQILTEQVTTNPSPYLRASHKSHRLFSVSDIRTPPLVFVDTA
jgi:hypothetical protein